MHSRNKDDQKPPSSVLELCKKLKIQLDELALTLDEQPPTEELKNRKDLFKALQEQLMELSS